MVYDYYLLAFNQEGVPTHCTRRIESSQIAEEIKFKQNYCLVRYEFVILKVETLKKKLSSVYKVFFKHVLVFIYPPHVFSFRSMYVLKS